MTGDADRSGTTLVEPKVETEIALPEAAPQETRRSYWPLVALLAAAVVLVGTWALVWRPATDEPVQQPAGAVSEHDSGIAAQLRARTATADVGEQHDSGIAAQLRAQTATADVGEQHDSGIAAQLRARAGSSCVAPGAGGWEARLASGC